MSPQLLTAVRRLKLNLIVFGGVLLLATFVEVSAVGWGIDIYVGALLLSAPGALLSALLLAGPPFPRWPRLLAGLTAAVVSAVSVWVIVTLRLEGLDTGPYPADMGPFAFAVAAFAGLTGLAAGATSVALHQTLERSAERSPGALRR